MAKAKSIFKREFRELFSKKILENIDAVNAPVSSKIHCRSKFRASEASNQELLTNFESLSSYLPLECQCMRKEIARFSVRA